MRRILLIFVKFPTPGRVKTRLARAIGPDSAAEAYRLMVSRVLQRVCYASLEEIWITYDPAEMEQEVRDWLSPQIAGFSQRGFQVKFIPQTSGNLGQRLLSAFESAFSSGAGMVATIGTDCIDLTADHLDLTWSCLQGGPDVVFGPADDGGYYLVALSSPAPALFKGIPWSTADTLQKSLQRAEEIGLEHHLLEPLSDIDEYGDWLEIKRSLEP